MATPESIQAARQRIAAAAVREYNAFGWIPGTQNPSPANPRIAGKKCADSATRARQGARKLIEIFSTAGVQNSNLATISVDMEKGYVNNTVTTKDRNTKDMPSWCGIFALYCYFRAGLGKMKPWPLKVGKGAGVDQFSASSPQQCLFSKKFPEMGDIGVYDYSSTGQNHHFIILSCDPTGGMYTIDGNSGWLSEITLNFRTLGQMATKPSAIYKPVWDAVL